jgi:hypothetical protein
VVMAYRPESRLGDPRIQSFDGRTLLRVRTDVQYLRYVALGERFHAQGRRDLSVDLLASGREVLFDLVFGGFLRHDDHERPAPGGAVAAKDDVEIRCAIGAPPQPFERPDLRDDASALEGEPQPVCRSVEARNARVERLRSGLARSVDHDEPVLGDRQQADVARPHSVFVLTILRTLDRRIGRRTHRHEPQPRGVASIAGPSPVPSRSRGS